MTAINLAKARDLQVRSLGAWLAMMARGSTGGQLFERDGVRAAILPAVPERSICNSVVYENEAGFEAVLDELADTYGEAGVRAWSVWVPGHERSVAELLEGAGHDFDGSPVAMHRPLAGLPEPDPDDDLDWDDEATGEEVGHINDLAYGHEDWNLAAAIGEQSPQDPVRFYRARVDGKTACVAGAIDHEDAVSIVFVATLKAARGKRLAGRLMYRALIEARDRGLETTILQSSDMGQPAYERLGYVADFPLELWERRAK